MRIFRRNAVRRTGSTSRPVKALAAAGAACAFALVPMTSASASGPFDGVPVNIYNNNSGLCLSVPGASLAAATHINQYYCGGYPDQSWQVYATSRLSSTNDRLYQIVNKHSNQCLSVDAASKSSTAAVTQYPCNNYVDQFWELLGGPSGWWIVNNNSGLCLSVPGASKTATVGVNQYPCLDAPDQFWSFD